MTHTDRSQEAFKELASHYERTVDQELRKFWGLSYCGFVDQLLGWAGLKRTDAVLDIATGTALIPRTLAESHAPGARLVGLDFTFSALASGKQKIAPPGSGKAPVALTCASALALPFAPASFDGVICALATHHIDQAALLEQVHRVLRPGGQFILADVIASPAWGFPGVKALLRLAAFAYFFVTVSPARAWVESQAVSYVHTEQAWRAALGQRGFAAIRAHRPSVRGGWAASAILLAATKPAG